MLSEYKDLLKNYLAMNVVEGEKTEMEKFPGAQNTYSLEIMMQDKKALQGGTSHFLGQNFSKSNNIKFTNRNAEEEFAWTTSWGVTTRLIGGIIMIHSDDDGLILPPRIAPSQVVILPIMHQKENEVIKYCNEIKDKIEEIKYYNSNIEVIIDTRDLRGGEKKWQWIKKGIPVILEIGPKDLEKKAITYQIRNEIEKKHNENCEDFIRNINVILDKLQDDLYQKALNFRDNNLVKIDNEKEFYEYFTPKNASRPEIHGGFAYSHFSLDSDVEERIKKDLSVTVRCIPLEMENEEGICIFTKKKSKKRVIFAKAY